nr:random slug protein 5-like isoform X4 [Ipomoea trifida]
MFNWRKASQCNHQETESAESPAEKDAKIRELRAAIGALTGRSLKFCSDSCIRLYLEARNCDVEQAKKMLEETLKWRSTFKPEEIRWDEVAHIGETGKVSIANFHDRQGRTVFIMRPGKQKTSSEEDYIRHLVYLMETAIINLPEGQEQLSWLVDFSGWSLGKSVSIKTARDLAYILQNHYPERIALILFYNPPRLFEAFWKVVKCFADPRSFQKVKFVYPNNKDSMEVMESFFDSENLPKEFGGKAPLKYDHEEFSKLMIQEDIKTAKFWGFDDALHTAPMVVKS